jgi:ankyrin repeat protein
VEIVDQLLASGAGINEQDALGNSSLHYMCNGLSKKQIPQALALLERGANPLLRNAAGDTPVDYLDFDVARLLARDYLAMKRRKGAATRSEDEQHALELSIMHESVENVALLREGPEHVRTRMRTRSMCV